MEDVKSPVRKYAENRLRKIEKERGAKSGDLLFKTILDIARIKHSKNVESGKKLIPLDTPFISYRDEAVTFLLTYAPQDLEEYRATDAEIRMAKIWIEDAIKTLVLLDFVERCCDENRERK